MDLFDVGLRYRTEYSDTNRRYAAGLICVKNSEAGRMVVEEWNRLVDSTPLEWWMDQATLPKLAEYCETIGAKLWRMDGRISSLDSDSLNAFIWSRSRPWLGLSEKMDTNRAILHQMKTSRTENSKIHSLRSYPSTQTRATVRELTTSKRPLVSSDDLHFLSLSPFLLLSAIFVSEQSWPKAAIKIQKLADLLRPQPSMERLDDVATMMRADVASLSHWIINSRIGRTEHLIHCFRSLFWSSWAPRVEIEGEKQIDAALEGGKGVVLWVAHFCFSSLFTKVALARAGYCVSHISRPEHGVSKSWLGVTVLNRVRSAAEDQFLDKRIVHNRSNASVTKLRALQALQGNGIVSVTVGAWEGRRVAIGPLLGGEYKVALGAPGLAYTSGAPLLPVFTVRAPDGTYRTVIGSPLGESARDTLEGFLLKASEELFEQHGPMVLANPDQWRGWKDWLEQSRWAEREVTARAATR
jgi:lauroyl/myristoyl acyltransferase